MADPAAVELENVPCVAGSEGVRLNDAVRVHLLVDDRQQGPHPGVRNDRGVNLSIPLQQTKHSDFTRSAAPGPSFADATEIVFVSFHFTAEVIARQLACYKLAQTHEKSGSTCSPERQQSRRWQELYSQQRSFRSAYLAGGASDDFCEYAPSPL